MWAACATTLYYTYNLQPLPVERNYVHSVFCTLLDLGEADELYSTKVWVWETDSSYNMM